MTAPERNTIRTDQADRSGSVKEPSICCVSTYRRIRVCHRHAGGVPECAANASSTRVAEAPIGELVIGWCEAAADHIAPTS
jgi:hypothetical protein